MELDSDDESELALEFSEKASRLSGVRMISATAAEDEDDDNEDESDEDEEEEDETDASDSEAENVDEDTSEQKDEEGFGLKSLLEEDANKQSQVRNRPSRESRSENSHNKSLHWASSICRVAILVCPSCRLKYAVVRRGKVIQALHAFSRFLSRTLELPQLEIKKRSRKWRTSHKTICNGFGMNGPNDFLASVLLRRTKMISSTMQQPSPKVFSRKGTHCPRRTS